MADLGKKIQSTINEARPYVEDALKKAQDLTKQGAKFAEIKTTDWKISNKFSELGGRIYEASKSGSIEAEMDEPETKALIEELKKLEEDRENKEKDLEKMRGK